MSHTLKLLPSLQEFKAKISANNKALSGFHLDWFYYPLVWQFTILAEAHLMCRSWKSRKEFSK